MSTDRLDAANAQDNAYALDLSDIAPTNADELHFKNAEQEVIGARVATAIEGILDGSLSTDAI